MRNVDKGRTVLELRRCVHHDLGRVVLVANPEIAAKTRIRGRRRQDKTWAGRVRRKPVIEGLRTFQRDGAD